MCESCCEDHRKIFSGNVIYTMRNVLFVVIHYLLCTLISLHDIMECKVDFVIGLVCSEVYCQHVLKCTILSTCMESRLQLKIP